MSIHIPWKPQNLRLINAKLAIGLPERSMRAITSPEVYDTVYDTSGKNIIKIIFELEESIVKN